MEVADTPALLILDLPAQALGGIDLLSFTVTPRFHGVKDLPPGLHFVFAGTSTAFSERHGIWFRVRSGNADYPPLTITRWNSTAETLVSDNDEATNLRWRANLGSIWREGLTPYRQTSTSTSGEEGQTNDWSTLTSHITSSLLSRIISPSSSSSSSSTTSSPQIWPLSSSSSAPIDLEEIPNLPTSSSEKKTFHSNKELTFLPINLRQTWPSTATGRTRTEHAQDRSWALQHLSQTHCTSGDSLLEILGEMQFCFLMVLTINNFSCLEQWKRILQLIFTCRKAVEEKSGGFFVKAIAVLRLQLWHCRDAEGGWIDLTEESGGELKSLLLRFRNGVESLNTISSSSSTGIANVLDELDDLEDYLRQEHGWQFGGDFVRSGGLDLEDGERVEMDFGGGEGFDAEDETGEFAPVIVDLTEEQKRLMGFGGGEDGRGVEDTRRLGARLRRARLNEGIEGEVVDSEDEDEDGESEDSGEEMQDLDEMDSRY